MNAEELFGNPNITVNKVDINGIKFTQSWLLETHIQPILTASTLKEILMGIDKASHDLASLNIFKSIEVRLEADDEHSNSSPLRQILSPLMGDSKKRKQPHVAAMKPNQVNVIIDIKERPRFQMKTGTEIGANEGSVSASFLMRNVMGTGEVLEGTLSKGSITNSLYNLSFTKPVNGDPRRILTLMAYQKDENFSSTSSHILLTRAICSQLKMITSHTTMHELSHQMAFRQMSDISPSASLHIREYAAQDQLKTSLTHTFTQDSRNDLMIPSEGSLLKTTTELGLCFSSPWKPFVKQELESQRVYSLPMNSIFSSSIRCGLLKVLGETKEETASTPFYERFHLGGPLSVRGFSPRGIGPKAVYPEVFSASTYNKDSLGGDAYWALGMSLMTPVPGLAQFDGLKLHGFYNAGCLFSVKNGDNIFQAAMDSPVRTSVGLGICLRTAMCRLEANYIYQTSKQPADTCSGKFQLGIGMEFM